ncbi:Aste57867_23116 [Aphanomyces stellatus]|uniref:Aste57867_23116 protein n=1 Tax=Aphanomyces stellatus TaxID=120398 RepID=A0A485LNR9_9STRA|nr:hypothetical protein As57867_023045 [Aphanomyces stellatus]VFT99764.1 Aste57867_23116 [Aphanomyces stellatus]
MTEPTPVGDIDVAILTKELEVAFAEQLVKCTKTLQREMQAERERDAANTLEYLLSQVDIKLQHFKQELLAHVDQHFKQGQMDPRYGASSDAADTFTEAASRSESLVSNPTELDELAQLCLATDGGQSNPIDAVDHIDDDGGVVSVASLNVASHILQFTRVHVGAKHAISDCVSGECVAYEELLPLVGRVASGLQARGFMATDVLALYGTRAPFRMLVVIMAVWTLGGSVSWHLSTQPRPSNDGIIWACVDAGSTADEMNAETAFLHVIALDGARETSNDGIGYVDLSQTRSSLHPIKHGHVTHPTQIAWTVHTDDVATLEATVFSYSHADLIAAMDAAVDAFRFPGAASVLSALPLHAPESLTFAILPSLFFGTSLHLLPYPPAAPDLLAALRASAACPTTLVTTSLHLSDLCKANDALASLDDVVCIGASVPNLPRTLRALHTLASKWKPDLKFRRLYASLATAGVCMLSDVQTFPIPPTHLRSLGAPLPSVDVRIHSLSTGETLGAKQVGELCVRPRSGGDDFYRTHTMAYMDASGQVHGIGTRDGIVNLGTESTTTLELEEVLASHPLVDDAVVVVVAGGPPPPRLVAYVKFAAMAHAYLDDALRSVTIFAAKQMPPAKQIHALVAVRDVPRAMDGQPFRARVAAHAWPATGAT